MKYEMNGGPGLSPYGKWSNDEVGLPCFDLNLETTPDPDAPLDHLMSTGVITALINRWGDLRMMTCAGGEGQAALRPSPWHCLSDMLLTLELGSEFYSLVPGQCDPGRSVRWGIGYASFEGSLTRPELSLKVHQEFIASWDDSPGIIASFTLQNQGALPIETNIRIGAPIAALGEMIESDANDAAFEGGEGWIRADAAKFFLGKAILIGPDGWKPSCEYVTLILSHLYRLNPGQMIRFNAWVGCTPGNFSVDVAALRQKVVNFVPVEERKKWVARLAPVKMPAPAGWIAEECIWTAGQLLAFAGFDGSRGHKFIHLGGYGWNGFGVRECAETALAMASWAPQLATDSLYWLATNQWPSGDLPKGSNFNGRLEKTSDPVESDNEIWFLLALSEAITSGLDETILDHCLPFADGMDASLWEHARAAWYWIRDVIGIGPHGLVKIWHGDWDDYMNGMGRLGVGESTMNTGMACRAIDTLVLLARKRGEEQLASELEDWVAARRLAMYGAFDQTHYLRGFTDKGEPVGSYSEGRVHLNAQSWAILGHCGTPEMRRLALKTAVDECGTKIGLALISKPYSAPPPPQISWSPIPPGEGENGGIWPQTVHWAIWALAEEDMAEVAKDVWVAMSLRNHMYRHPNVPYGIWNGPDCYSSRLSGPREGWTQRQILDRFRDGIPMNPAVAWQAFSWSKIVKVSGNPLR
jgi:hypothetical protein